MEFSCRTFPRRTFPFSAAPPYTVPLREEERADKHGKKNGENMGNGNTKKKRENTMTSLLKKTTETKGGTKNER